MSRKQRDRLHPDNIPRVLVSDESVFYHGSAEKRRSAPPCSYFSPYKEQASGVVYGAYEEPTRARWVLVATLREPTVFLDITGGFERSFIGDTIFRHVMLPYITDYEYEKPHEGDYAKAFCEHRHELFPDCAGLYRELFGLLVAEPDAVMVYRTVRPALKRRFAWPPGGSRR